MKKYFEFKDAATNSFKFWQIELKGKKVTIKYGRIGIENLKNFDKISDEAIFFGEEQSRYIISVNENNYQIIND